MSARYFHVNTAEALIVGEGVYEKGKSYRIAKGNELSLLSLADNGIVTLTDRPVSFDSIRAGKDSESPRLPSLSLEQEARIEESSEATGTSVTVTQTKEKAVNKKSRKALRKEELP